MQHNIHGVIHFVVESHVDNSIKGPRALMETDYMGTFTLFCVWCVPFWMNAARANSAKYEELMTFVTDCPGYGLHYAIDPQKS